MDGQEIHFSGLKVADEISDLKFEKNDGTDIKTQDSSPCESPTINKIESPSRVLSSEILKYKNMSPGAVKLRLWLNKLLKIVMSDGRALVGTFLCTDRDANIILGSCSEYLPEDEECGSNEQTEEPRMLGLVMVPEEINPDEII